MNGAQSFESNTDREVSVELELTSFSTECLGEAGSVHILEIAECGRKFLEVVLNFSIVVEECRVRIGKSFLGVSAVLESVEIVSHLSLEHLLLGRSVQANIAVQIACASRLEFVDCG